MHTTRPDLVYLVDHSRFELLSSTYTRRFIASDFGYLEAIDRTCKNISCKRAPKIASSLCRVSGKGETKAAPTVFENSAWYRESVLSPTAHDVYLHRMVRCRCET